MESVSGRESIKQRMERYFAAQRYARVDLHTDAMSLHYVVIGENAYLVWMISQEALRNMTPELYRGQLEKIRGIFLEKGAAGCSVLAVFVTSDTEKVKQVAQGTAFWIADEAYGRLIVYENQMEDFLGLRNILEQNLHFGADVRNADGMQKQGAFAAQPGYVSEASTQGAYKAGRRKGITGGILAYLVTIALVAANVIIFLCIKSIELQSLKYGNIAVMVFRRKEYYRLFTSVFLHQNFEHLANNMISLVLAGTVLEKKLGHIRFGITYFLTGIAASVVSAVCHQYMNEIIISIGASGAIYGVFGALAITLLLNRAKNDNGILIRTGVFILYLVYSTINSAETIDNAAHIGGFIAGTLVGLLWFWLERLYKCRKREKAFR